jgi:hypothetical protein
MVVAFAVIIAAGCRHFPNEPAPAPVTVQGVYRGVGVLGGSATNVTLGITGPDSVGHFTGSIDYRTVLTALDSIVRDSTGDSLRFRYARDNVIYRAVASLTSTTMLLNFTAPSEIPQFRLNKEIGGYNLSGYWSGAMYSNFLQTYRTATMSMDQDGNIFIGTVDVNLIESAHANISTGGYSQNEFQFNGTAQIASSQYPTAFGGHYVNADSVVGNWQVGTNGEIDSGTFNFGRSHQ